MVHSSPVYGKSKMNWFDYIFTHLIPTWFKSFNDNFVMWRDLITGDYEKYKLLKNDDAFQECYDWFWGSINVDETYPKEFLEYLYQMSEDVKSGKVETIPFTREMFDELEELVGDIEVNLNEKLKEEDE
tara:strand:- start:306 stop:692 length:387 start_codon:yes stop_codon:yes gene_type:complete